MKKQTAPRMAKFYSIALRDLRSALAQYHQWNNPGSIGLKYEHYCRLEAMVDLFEGWDCGSWGGYGKGQPANQNLAERADWLLAKYET